MSEAEGNPRKRLRLENPVEHEAFIDEESALQQDLPARTVVYDSRYNAPDVDVCVIRVEDTIFKVHQFLLSRDSVMFRDMLTFPQSGETKSVNDAEAIVLQDKVADFRILCWGLYALPTELNTQLAADANIANLKVLADMANKYQFLSLEEWALTTIIHHFCTHGLVAKLSFEELLEYLATAVRCSANILQELVENAIIHKMEKSDIDLNALPEPIEVYGSRRLKGMMHYFFLVKQDRARTHHQLNTAAVEAGSRDDANYDWAAIAYRGYFSLSKWWKRFIATEKARKRLPRAPKCPRDFHTKHCERGWPTHFWFLFERTGEDVEPIIDVLDRLSTLQKLAASLGPESLSEFDLRMNSRQCLPRWAAHIAKVRQGLIDTMADHFYGSLPAEVVVEVTLST